MTTIRDVVEALGQRPGVDAVVVVGRDGLPIDSRVGTGLDAESVAALLPSVVHSLTQLGDAGARGRLTAGAVEYDGGTAVVAILHADALLVVLAQPGTNVGPLLFDLRRHRAAIAGLL